MTACGEGKPAPNTVAEQMLAFGHSIDYIAAKLGLTVEDVYAVCEHLDRVNRHGDDDGVDRCRSGRHIMAGDNLYVRPDRPQIRQCLACRNERRKVWRARRRAA